MIGTAPHSPRKPYLEQLDSFAGMASIFADVYRMFDEADYTPTMNATAERLRETHDITYSAMSDPNGVPWPPNKTSTIAKKGHGIVLVETGRLKASVLEPAHPDHIQDVMPDGRGMAWGTGVEYGAVHQDGLLAPRVPQREFLGMTEKTVNEITEAVADRAVSVLINGA